MEQPSHAPRIRLITRDQGKLVRVWMPPLTVRSAAVRPTTGWRWPVRGRLTSSYGGRRHPITQNHHVHPGIDLAAPSGTPVRAVADGRVRVADWVDGYGRLIELDHGQGWTTRYGHLQRALVASEQVVEAGEMIALVGSTGRSTGPHLHFEIRRHGQPVDPLSRLSARSGTRLALRPSVRSGDDG